MRRHTSRPTCASSPLGYHVSLAACFRAAGAGRPAHSRHPRRPHAFRYPTSLPLRVPRPAPTTPLHVRVSMSYCLPPAGGDSPVWQLPVATPPPSGGWVGGGVFARPLGPVDGAVPPTPHTPASTGAPAPSLLLEELVEHVPPRSDGGAGVGAATAGHGSTAGAGGTPVYGGSAPSLPQPVAVPYAHHFFAGGVYDRLLGPVPTPPAADMPPGDAGNGAVSGGGRLPPASLFYALPPDDSRSLPSEYMAPGGGVGKRARPPPPTPPLTHAASAPPAYWTVDAGIADGGAAACTRIPGAEFGGAAVAPVGRGGFVMYPPLKALGPPTSSVTAPYARTTTAHGSGGGGGGGGYEAARRPPSVDELPIDLAAAAAAATAAADVATASVPAPAPPTGGGAPAWAGWPLPDAPSPPSASTRRGAPAWTGGRPQSRSSSRGGGDTRSSSTGGWAASGGGAAPMPQQVHATRRSDGGSVGAPVARRQAGGAVASADVTLLEALSAPVRPPLRGGGDGSDRTGDVDGDGRGGGGAIGRGNPPSPLSPQQLPPPAAAVPPPRRRRSRRRARPARSASITWEALSSTFHMPRAPAAATLGVCVTVLKRRCRCLGLSKWPYRSLAAVNAAIGRLEARLAGGAGVGGGAGGGVGPGADVPLGAAVALAEGRWGDWGDAAVAAAGRGDGGGGIAFSGGGGDVAPPAGMDPLRWKLAQLIATRNRIMSPPPQAVVEEADGGCEEGDGSGGGGMGAGGDLLGGGGGGGWAASSGGSGAGVYAATGGWSGGCGSGGGGGGVVNGSGSGDTGGGYAAAVTCGGGGGGALASDLAAYGGGVGGSLDAGALGSLGGGLMNASLGGDGGGGGDSFGAAAAGDGAAAGWAPGTATPVAEARGDGGADADGGRRSWGSGGGPVAAAPLSSSAGGRPPPDGGGWGGGTAAPGAWGLTVAGGATTPEFWIANSEGGVSGAASHGAALSYTGPHPHGGAVLQGGGTTASGGPSGAAAPPPHEGPAQLAKAPYYGGWGPELGPAGEPSRHR